MTNPIARRIQTYTTTIAPVLRFVMDSPYAHRNVSQPHADLALGNPQEMPLPGIVDALERWAVPQHKDWFAYTMNLPTAQEAAAAGLRERVGVAFAAEDIHLTNAAFVALAVALNTLVDPSDEVIFISPPWFFYEMMIQSVGGVPVRVRIDPHSFDLDLAAIEAALSPRTRAIIVNTPNNPTGKIYPPSTLTTLAGLLDRASARTGRTVYLLSDESYHRIIFDGREFHSPTRYYANSLLLYTYGKTLLAPGQRIGYIALPPSMPHRAEIGQAITAAQMALGWAFPNALLQHALPDLEALSIDISRLQARRDRLVAELTAMGYEVTRPEGTFYLMVRAPIADDEAFAQRLGEARVYVLPGTVVEMPGYFRLSVTASDDMIDFALPVFARAREEALQAATL